MNPQFFSFSFAESQIMHVAAFWQFTGRDISESIGFQVHGITWKALEHFTFNAILSLMGGEHK